MFGYYANPGTPQFKVMVRTGDWKYIFMANGGREQLFNLRDDPNELANLVETQGEVKQQLSSQAAAACRRPELSAAMEGDALRQFPFQARPLRRIYQFDLSRGLSGFPGKPEEVLKAWRA